MEFDITNHSPIILDTVVPANFVEFKETSMLSIKSYYTFATSSLMDMKSINYDACLPQQELHQASK